MRSAQCEVHGARRFDRKRAGRSERGSTPVPVWLPSVNVPPPLLSSKRIATRLVPPGHSRGVRSTSAGFGGCSVARCVCATSALPHDSIAHGDSMINSLRHHVQHLFPQHVSNIACAAVIAGVVGVLLAPARGQDLPVARQAGAGYELWSAPAGGAAATLVLDGASFLPLRLSGATWRERLRRGIPVEAVADTGTPLPARHIRLPGGGSLFLADLPGLTALLHVRADGSLTIAYAAIPGPGGPAILPSVAVRADGRAALLATAADAGGDLVVVDLPPVAGTALPEQVLTLAQPPLDLVAASLRLSATHAFAIAGSGSAGQLLRAALGAPSAATVALPLPAGSTLLPETVLSAEGASLALIGQVPGGLRHVIVVRPSGSPVALTSAPAALDAPSLQSPVGPLLALAADGSQVAWRATVNGSKELFLRAVPAAVPSPPAAQVTGDAFFTDTLDNAGILGFAPIAAPMLVFAAGEQEGGGTLDSGDIYTATLALSGAPILSNATKTSGDTAAPFLVPGELEVTGAVLDPRGERLLLSVDPDGGDGALYALPADGSGPGSMLLPPFAQENPLLVRAGDSVLVLSVPDSAPSGGTQLHLVRPLHAAGVAVQLLGTAPPSLLLDRFTDSADGARLAFVARTSASASLALPVRVSVADGAVLPAWTELHAVSPLMALPPSGVLAAGVGVPNGPFLFVAFTGFATGSVLHVPVGYGFPLPF